MANRVEEPHGARVKNMEGVTFVQSKIDWCTKLPPPSRFEDLIVLINDLLDCQTFLWFGLEHGINERFEKVATSVNLLGA